MAHILKHKKDRAQIAIEFIVFLAIFLLFFQAIIMPNVTLAENVLKDVHSLTEAKQNISYLATNIEAFGNSNGFGKRTMFFIIPTNTTISCSNSPNKINYTVLISNQRPVPSQCPNSICSFSRDIYLGNKNLYCDNVGPGYSGPIVIEKNSVGDINVSFQ